MISSIFNSKASRRSAAAALLLVCAAVVAARAVLRAVFLRPNFQSMAVDALGPQTDTLVIGSSRVFFGFDPEHYGPRVMSLAADYLDLSTAEELWHRHRSKVPHLKTLVLEFGLATLRYDTRTLEPYACYQLGLDGLPPASMFLEDFDGAVHRSLSVFFKWRLTPIFWNLHRDMMASSLEPISAKAGFIPTGVQFNGDVQVARRRQEKTVEQLKLQNPKVYARNLAAGKRLIAAANQEGIRVVLLRFPKSPEARSLYLPAWDTIVHDAMKSLGTDERHLVFSMIDLNRDERFVTADFRDPDHLNRRGAVHLAEILAPRLTP